MAPFNYDFNRPIGIDLGTSNSVIAYYANTLQMKGAQVYNLNTAGRTADSKLMPSCVFLEEEDGVKEILVGNGALNQKASDPTRFAQAIKRQIGEKSSCIKLAEEYFSPIELSKRIIKALFKDPFSQQPALQPAGIVVSVPYYFKQHQNTNTKEAVQGAIDELFSQLEPADRPPLLSLIPEPVAVAIGYLAEKSGLVVNDRKILVFDLGGGTLDVTIFNLNISSDAINFEIMISDGDAYFGGEDFDEILYQYILNQEGIDSSNLNDKLKRIQKSKLLDQSREVKEMLSNNKEYSFIIGNLPSGQYIDREVKRGEFESLLAGNNHLDRDFGSEVKDIIDTILMQANIAGSDINQVMLIGGSSRIPYFQNILKTKFPNASLESSPDDMNYGVAKGAALYAAYLLDEVHGHNHQPIGKSIDYKKSEIILKTTHGLGIEKGHGRFSMIVPPNSVVPAKKLKTYKPTSYTDSSQKTVSLNKISVYQGKEKHTKDNTFIGEVQLPVIYTHGREIQDIPIQIEFEASDTLVQANIFIPNGGENQQDISITDYINLT
jgi:molecular chaperone DnaK